ncbi:MAG: LytTR family DNA-binding domain-containing protein [Oscillospiraceae bacterium]
MLKIAICDDEKYFRNQIKKLIDTYDFQIEYIVTEYSCGEELIFQNNNKRDIDILFLDVEMIGLNGVEVAKKLRTIDENLIIIFITSYNCYVCDAFEVKAFQYLTKPVAQLQFNNELKRAVEQYTSKDFLFKVPQIDLDTKKRFTILYPPEEIIYFESKNKYIIIHTKKERHKFMAKLNDVATELESCNFVRCHKSYLVNISYVKKIYNQKLILLIENIELPISQSKKSKTLLQLKSYWERKYL